MKSNSGQTRHFKNDSEKTFAPSVDDPLYTLSVKTDDQNRICSFYLAQKNPYIKTTLVIRNGVQAATASLKFV